jgi:uncharacterized membrane protein
MTYLQLAYWHLASILPAFFIGTYLLLSSKGTPSHKLLGKIYMLLMLCTAITTLFMPAEIGPRLFNHFGWIHSLCVIVLVNVPLAYFAARKGNIARHKGAMIGMYVGALLIAGSFALMPGRLLHEWIFL